VSTVQRWERREGMPVHRHLHDKQGSVFAFRAEIDEWWESRRTQLARQSPAVQPVPADDSRLAPDALSPSPPSVPPSNATSSSTPLTSAPPPRSQLLWRSTVALALLLLAGTVAWYVIDTTSSQRNPLANAKFSRLSDFDAAEQAAAISPNGKFVAFLANRGGRTDAWVGEIGNGVYRNLTDGALPELSNPSIRTLGFSADSSSFPSGRGKEMAPNRATSVSMLRRQRAVLCVRICRTPQNSTGPGMVDGSCITLLRPVIRSSYVSAEQPPPAKSTLRQPVCTAIFRCGLRTVHLFTSYAACLQTTGTSGEFEAPARASSG
jgi:hypothetical protein